MTQTELIESVQKAATVIKTQHELIDLLYSQVVDLTMMSKIELGDDVIEEFSPRRSLAERYSIEGMAKSRGMSVEEFKVSIDEEIKIKNDLIQKYLDKGYSQEQAETTAMRIMYIPGFSGPTFNNETIESYE